MALQVTDGALLMCSFGSMPSPLGVLPVAKTMAGGKPAATIMDNVPMLNIKPFGPCMSIANPTVAAATAAALGVLTPMPCIPAPAGPWIPGSVTVMIGNKPALNSNCKLMCSYAGVIQVSVPTCMNVMVP